MPLSHRKCPEVCGPWHFSGQRVALLESVWHCRLDARCQPWHVHNRVKLNTWALMPDLMGTVLTEDHIYFLKCGASHSVSSWLYIIILTRCTKREHLTTTCKYRPVFISEDHTFELLPLRQRSRTWVSPLIEFTQNAARFVPRSQTLAFFREGIVKERSAGHALLCTVWAHAFSRLITHNQANSTLLTASIKCHHHPCGLMGHLMSQMEMGCFMTQ